MPLSRLLDLTADAVLAVRQGRSLTDVLARVAPDARPGVQALTFHVMRWLGSAGEVRALVAPKTPPPNVESLLLTALALLWPTGEAPPYADHTLVDQAVNAARQRTPVAAGFINAVLRRFVRERDKLAASARHQPLGAFNHPLWWIERVRHDWPTQWQALLEAANLHPPFTLRVNRRRGSGEAYVQRLAAQGRAASLVDDPPLLGQAVVLAEPCPVTQLPGFAEGEVSVQDAAAQRAAPLLVGAGLPAGARVLDACAAPGGKTAHLLELADLDLLALDSDPARLVRVQENLHRLQLQAQVRAGDARDTAAWWDGRPFDAILLDAPCSAAGIVRRHPDVRWLRRPDDITALARLQAEMLDALWPLLAPGGRLVYATCSLFRSEGAEQIDAFLQRHGDAGASLDPLSPGHLLPLADNSPQPSGPARRALHDGFYYALIHKA
ncbi:16S rRNA (cytosine967-C5)-methyltransferase [Rubrivivax gelatinosus]|uniref:16S rRNA (cytosine(967)-C(5))-methyltransferase n=1 Tax=Rubrivivax gelatinosus TaxID=28068 RepID=A0A4R2MNN7_RUBGE|nr:16S rRNA (cytosine(967)-C(5))-methyltransferase RsmB [Rubrivivax gelatinosus]MBK1686534.1 16S rRNA (cytosine(967)-C(5))-methyltransferase [Rubrivivax gelatinosus]TCP00933.1 16S rRNA (cytosine967-C5)-methyltransferase [Rubrivivax gelatinosus]